MIPVRPQPEPADFDKRVRQKGRQWLTKKQLPASGPVPQGTVLNPYWKACLDDLYRAYGGVCAYLGCWFPLSSGAANVEHFVAKSTNIEGAYEWTNYRLATLGVNARKNAHLVPLDPFTMPADVYHLELVTGAIYPNPQLTTATLRDAVVTLELLGLDNARCRADRSGLFLDYINHPLPDAYFERKAPFVFSEVRRQGLLRA